MRPSARLAVTALLVACRGPSEPSSAQPPIEAPRTSAELPLAIGSATAPACTATPQPAGVRERGVNAAGDRRSYRLIVPSGYRAEQPARLLLGFHGYGQSLDGAAASELVERASQAGYLVALPQGGSLGPSPPCWNAGSCCAPCSTLGFDDVALARAVIADVKASFCVDPERVYVAGFSNGAMMAYRLACTMGSELAGVVAVSGTIVASECNGDVRGAPSMLIAHGTDDEIVPIAGGAPEWAGNLPFDWPSMADVVTRTRSILACSEQHQSSTLARGRTRDHYGNCAGGRELEVHTIEHGRHRWPRAGFNEDVLAFFERNRRS